MKSGTIDRHYFRLLEECYYVEGAKRAAVHNLLSGHVYPIEAHLKGILLLCEQNYAVEDAAEQLEMPLDSALTFLLFLEQRGLGTFSNKPRYVEKIRKVSELKVEPYYRLAPRLFTVFLEMPATCDYDCWFCRPAGGTNRKRNPCLGCRRFLQADGEFMPWDDLEEVLAQVRQLEAPEIILTGGNPLTLSVDHMGRVLKAASASGFHHTCVITNGHTRNEAMIDLLISHHVHPIVQVYACRDAAYDTVSRVEGSYGRVIRNLDRFREEHLSFTILLLQAGEPLSQVKEVFEFYRTLEPRSVIVDGLFRHEKQAEPEQSADRRLELPRFAIGRQDIPKTTLAEFLHKQKHSSCLYGKLAITQSKKVLPCPMLRDEILGELEHDTLAGLFEQGIVDSYWNMTKDTLKSCSACEYRYACSDCRASEKAVSGTLCTSTQCAYDPQEGTWKD